MLYGGKLMKQYFVYILASQRNGTLYVGISSDLAQRVEQHRSKESNSFTAKHGVIKLVHYEVYDDPETAIVREKRLKKWNRTWKLDLIETQNPQWLDLYDTLNA
jgi:putative endonuclease